MSSDRSDFLYNNIIMAKQTKTYQNVTPEIFNKIRTAFEQYNVKIPDQPSGSIEGPSGFTISWVYDKEHTLAITLDGSIFKMAIAWHYFENTIDPCLA